METTQKQRVSMVLIGVVLGAIYFAPSLLRFFTTLALHQARASSAEASSSKSPAGSPAPGTGAAGASGTDASQTAIANTADDPALAKYLGKWEGNVVIPQRGTCTLKLEVKDNHDKDHPFAGYSKLSCFPTMIELLAKKDAKKETPAEAVADIARITNATSAILAGSYVKGSAEFLAQKNFGVAEVSNGCDMASLSITQFGSNQVAAEWKESQEGSCHGGQMIMNKSGS